MKVKETSSLGKAVLKSSGLKTLEGVSGKHSYSEDERLAFAEHLNNIFSEDPYLSANKYFPVDTETNQLFQAISDGVVLCKLVNLAHPETIDERTINYPKKGGKGKKLNRWEMQENQKLAINSAKSIGCKVVNLHADDLIDCVATSKEYIVLGIVWQLVRMQLLKSINVKEKPEMILLLKEGEELKDLLKLAPEKILLRWFNYHLDQGAYGKKIKNLGSDLKDSKAFITLLSQIDASCIKAGAADIADPKERASAVIDASRSIGAKSFIKAEDIIAGNKRLTLALVAQIFNTNSGLVIKQEEVEAAFEAAGLGDDDESAANREIRTYKQWASSFDLSTTAISGDSTTLTDMREGIRDGVALLQLIECMSPGLVDKKRCTLKRSKLNRFKAVENCNYAVELLTKELKVNLPGIGGVDINNANANVMEAIMWQLMRLSVVKLLKELGGGKEPKDSEIVAWANKTIAEAGTSTRKISSFRDKSIADGRFLLDLLAAVEPRAINAELVTEGKDEEEIKQNNRYVISVARKIGASVFLTWEDIAEVKPKMVMQLMAGIMHAAKTKA